MNAKELRQKSEQELSDTKKNLEKEIREVSLNTLQGKEKNRWNLIGITLLE